MSGRQAEDTGARVGLWLCIGGASIAARGVLAWMVGAGAATALVRGQPEMVPSTALSLLLLGIAGALRHTSRDRAEGELLSRARVLPRAASLALALFVLSIGTTTLAGYALGIGGGLFEGPSVHGWGRPSPPAGLALTCLAAALESSDPRPAARSGPRSGWSRSGASPRSRR